MIFTSLWYSWNTGEFPFILLINPWYSNCRWILTQCTSFILPLVLYLRNLLISIHQVLVFNTTISSLFLSESSTENRVFKQTSRYRGHELYLTWQNMTIVYPNYSSGSRTVEEELYQFLSLCNFVSIFVVCNSGYPGKTGIKGCLHFDDRYDKFVFTQVGLNFSTIKYRDSF